MKWLALFLTLLVGLLTFLAVQAGPLETDVIYIQDSTIIYGQDSTYANYHVEFKWTDWDLLDVGSDVTKGNSSWPNPRGLSSILSGWAPSTMEDDSLWCVAWGDSVHFDSTENRMYWLSKKRDDADAGGAFSAAELAAFQEDNSMKIRHFFFERTFPYYYVEAHCEVHDSGTVYLMFGTDTVLTLNAVESQTAYYRPPRASRDMVALLKADTSTGTGMYIDSIRAVPCNGDWAGIQPVNGDATIHIRGMYRGDTVEDTLILKNGFYYPLHAGWVQLVNGDALLYKDNEP